MKRAEFRDLESELSRFQYRLGVAGAVVVAAFALLALRFLYLQLVQHDYYRTKAEDNRISVIPLVPNRGLIMDRSGVVLARNESQYTLEISLQKVANAEATINAPAISQRFLCMRAPWFPVTVAGCDSRCPRRRKLAQPHKSGQPRRCND